MKDVLNDLADLMSRASKVQCELVQLENDARDLMRRIELAEAKKIEVKISPTQMFDEIRERCFDIPLHVDSVPGRTTVTLGQITAQGENMDEAITTLYKLIKYRELIWRNSEA